MRGRGGIGGEGGWGRGEGGRGGVGEWTGRGSGTQGEVSGVAVKFPSAVKLGLGRRLIRGIYLHAGSISTRSPCH